MAARRLVALLIALLVISTIATALAPPRESEDESSSTMTTEQQAPEQNSSPVSSDLVETSLDASDPDGNESIRAALGDQLDLTVKAGETVLIEIPDLGLYGTAARGAPVYFDLIMRREGSFEVTAGGKRIGTIEVGGENERRQRRAEPDEEADEPSSDRNRPSREGASIAT